MKQSGERDTTSFRNREEYEPLGQFVRYNPPPEEEYSWSGVCNK